MERGIRSARGRTRASTATSSSPAPAMRVHTASIGASPAAMRYFAIGPENAKQHELTNASASPAYLIAHHLQRNHRLAGLILTRTASLAQRSPAVSLAT
ncbi:hypothetical protein GCM10020001_031390 [Nonomuraea salmonea]